MSDIEWMREPETLIEQIGVEAVEALNQLVRATRSVADMYEETALADILDDIARSARRIQ